MKYNLSGRIPKVLPLIMALLAIVNGLFSQSTPMDTLTLGEAIDSVMNQYPAIQMSEEALSVSDAKISLARTGYLPDVDINASFSRVGPVPVIDFNGHQIQLYPDNNILASLNYQQNIYDFGKTAGKVKAEQQGKKVAAENVEVIRQQLTKRVVNLYYSILYFQEALMINDQQIDNLQKHLDRIIKKKETGSATDFEVLSTRVKVTAAETRRADLESSMKIQMAYLNSLLGNSENATILVSKRIDMPFFTEIQDSSLNAALQNRPELKIAAAKEKLLEIRIDQYKNELHPVLRAFATAGGKNGYMPEINKIKGNYTVGVGLRIPLYDASRTRYNVAIARSSLTSSLFEKELTIREITNEVVESSQRETAAAKRLQQSELQVKQAAMAFELATSSYNAGSITNLELLDATTVLAESKLMLLKAKMDLIMSFYALQLAEGKKLSVH